MNFDQLPLSKAQQRRKRKDDEPDGYTPDAGNEDELQQSTDSLIELLGMFNFRLHAGLFRRMTPSLRKHYKGWPDNLAALPVSDKYLLVVPIENKRKDGERHGAQKNWEKQQMPFQLSRSIEKNKDILLKFKDDAAIVRGLFEAQGLNK